MWITFGFIGNVILFDSFCLKNFIDYILLARYYLVYINETFNCLDDTK